MRVVVYNSQFCVEPTVATSCSYLCILSQKLLRFPFHQLQIDACRYMNTSLSFYRAVSINLCGKEDMHVELRVRTVCEMSCHSHYYLRPEGGFVEPHPKRQSSNARLHATSANMEKASSCNVPDGSNLARETFILDCIETTKECTYCNMWHIHALSSVLHIPIRSIYPNFNAYVRPLLNKTVIPREEVSSQSDHLIYIMWTRAAPMHRSGAWSPNHFVTCIPLQSKQSVVKTHSKSVEHLKSPPSKAAPGCNSSTLHVMGKGTLLVQSRAIKKVEGSSSDPIIVCDSTDSGGVASFPLHTHKQSSKASYTTGSEAIQGSQGHTCPGGGPSILNRVTAPVTQSQPPLQTHSKVLHDSTKQQSPLPKVATMLLKPKATVSGYTEKDVHTHKQSPYTTGSEAIQGSQGHTCPGGGPSILNRVTAPVTQSQPPLQTHSKVLHDSTKQQSPLPKVATMLLKPKATVSGYKEKDVHTHKQSPYTTGSEAIQGSQGHTCPGGGPSILNRVTAPVTQSQPPLQTHSKVLHDSTKQQSPLPKVATMLLKPKATVSGYKEKDVHTHKQFPHTTGSEAIQGSQVNVMYTCPGGPSISKTQSQPPPQTHSKVLHDSTKQQSPFPKVATILLKPKTTVSRYKEKGNCKLICDPTYFKKRTETGRLKLKSTPTKVTSKQLSKSVPPVSVLLLKKQNSKQKITSHLNSRSMESFCTAIHTPSHNQVNSPQPSSSYFNDLTPKSDHDSDSDMDVCAKISLDSLSESTSDSDIDMDTTPLPSSSPECVQKLPFPNLPRSWYKREQCRYNLARDTRRKHNPTERNDAGVIISMNRSHVNGSLETNCEALREKLKLSLNNSSTIHYRAILEVADYIILHGHLIKTQQAGQVYLDSKGLKVKKTSCEFYEIFAKHLNLIQIYIFSTAYLSPNTSNISSFIDAVTQTVNTESTLHSIVMDRIKDTYRSALEYMDTHRDKQVMKAIMAQLTSARFAAKLQGISSRQGITSAKSQVSSHLVKYAEIKRTSQIVRDDLTTSQQHQLTRRIISRRKLEEIRTIAVGRGRKLKLKENPELCLALEYAFGEHDTEEGGGGLEAHPRLTTGTVYRAADNVTTMRQAREIILSMAPQGFTISLSCCYNYTENYREGTAQAKRHHSGRGVNASLSLKKPPRTGVKEIVVNLHWSTANVNCIIDNREEHQQSLVISKDAKAIVMADIAPVQTPGHSWKKREVPDHTWDQSRTNAITPMTFLFLETKVTSTTKNAQDTLVHITRTGQAVTLVYLSFFEPDTTFKCMNEIFLLLADPALDHLFRDKVTGSLKKDLTFVVDNGPQERPSNPLVQMCLVRLLRLLGLERVCQVSFAEYHSKRNFVERVHAEENRVLSKHGPFDSHVVHKSGFAGSTKHKENMEHMATNVVKCIKTGQFGKRPLLCYRGVEQKDYLFNDQDTLESFLGLSEQAKEDFCNKYKVKDCKLLHELHFIWGIDVAFEGDYYQDYKLLRNSLPEKTAWVDKYTTILFSPSCSIDKKELQPIPDLIR